MASTMSATPSLWASSAKLTDSAKKEGDEGKPLHPWTWKVTFCQSAGNDMDSGMIPSLFANPHEWDLPLGLPSKDNKLAAQARQAHPYPQNFDHFPNKGFVAFWWQWNMGGRVWCCAKKGKFWRHLSSVHWKSALIAKHNSLPNQSSIIGLWGSWNGMQSGLF